MERSACHDTTDRLAALYEQSFGGRSSGKFRISRKFLRELTGRRRLPDAFLAALADAMFEAGFVFVDCESYFIVLSQKQFSSYRRVTAAAVGRVMAAEEAHDESRVANGVGRGRADDRAVEDQTVQEPPDIC